MRRTQPAHMVGSRVGSRRAKVLLAVFGATVGLGIVGTGVAFGYFVTTDPSNPAQAVANSLPVRKYLPRTTSCSATRQQVVRQSR
ncbi:MAG: hypothetical protein ABR972_14625 [Acidimicrobiales bacterium]